jgi:glycerol dehydrogenase-like iron-containing ADH family enzyme
MSKCPGTDALTTIASALEWDVEQGLRHVNTCPECAEQLRALQLTHQAYEEGEEVSPVEVNSIVAALADARAAEHVRNRRTSRIGDVVEALLAGGTAVTVLNATGTAAPTSVAVATFGVVAMGLLGYRVMKTTV